MMDKVPLGFFSNIFKRRSPNDIISRSKSDSVVKTLNWYDILILGISCVIGSGIFVMVGEAACGNAEHVGAGPSLVISIILAGVACIFPALCYAEFAAAIPDSGSSYTYIYTTMGEFAAWLTGWVLILEYMITNITISVAWSGYLFQFLEGFNGILPNWLIHPPVWLVNDYSTAVMKCQVMGINLDTIPQIFGIPIALNLPAIFILLAIAWILTRGTQESARMATLMVIVKMAVILLFIVVCAFYVKPSNWVPFMPNGIDGVILGTFIIFYAYLGFDALATTAEETKDPQKNIPIGMFGTLIVASLVYCAVAIVFTGVIPVDMYSMVDIHAPIAHITRLIHQDWIAGFISLGAIAGLTSVLLVLQYANSRIIYAMARDNFLPKVLRIRHKKYRTPHVILWSCATILIILGMFIDMSVAAQLCIFGTLTCFILVCSGILILRKTHPEIERPFKVPFCPWFPIMGIIICITLMIKAMPSLEKSSILFPIWIVIGIIIYLMYGYDKNREAEEKEKMLMERFEKLKEEKNEN
ncbi:MAG: amino acid permease [Candidatus Gastranaerophilales bacterium]|nr:amino acid permease [Candidatus Gastranaerophilales bacterium]